MSVAAMVRIESDATPRIEDARLILSGVAPIPWRSVAAEEELIGAEVSEALFARAAEAVLAGAAPLQHNAYKLPLARAFIQRALATLAGQARADGFH